MKKLFLLMAVLACNLFAQIPTNGLIAHFPFSGNANDLSGNANNGTVQGGVTWTSDRFGNTNSAALFDGINGNIIVPNSSSLASPTNGLTIAGWVSIDSDHNIVSSLIDKAPNDAYGQYNYTFEHVNNGQFKQVINNGGTIIAAILQSSIPINQWCFIACSWNGTETTFYLDGTLIGTQPLAGTILPDNNPVYIGLQKAGFLNNHFKGKIDDIRIYNRALSESEINSLYHENNWNSTDIASNWPFTEMSGTSLLDHSGNGNHGQINGAAWQSNSGLRCLSFNGVNDYVTVPHNSTFNVGTGDFTIEAQFKTSVIPTTSWVSIFSKHNTATWHDKEIFLSIVGTTGFPTFDLSDGTGYFERATGTTNVCDGLVHTVRGVRQGNQLKIYVDGDLQATVSASINPDNNNPVNIGRSSYANGYGYFNGTISRISFWKQAINITPVEENSNNIVDKYILYQNYPNPFNPTTTIRYSLPKASKVLLKVYGLIGNEIAALVNEQKEAGYYEETFDASNLSNGVYFYQLQAGNFMSTKKLILLK